MKLLKLKAIQNMMDIKEALLLWFIIIFNKKSAGSGVKNEITQKLTTISWRITNQLLENFKNEDFIHHLKTIFGADLVDMQFLCDIDIYSKYAWVIPLKEKKGVTIDNAIQKILDDSKRKANKTWVDKGSEFYNRSIKLWFQKEWYRMCSAHNEGKICCCWKIY